MGSFRFRNSQVEELVRQLAREFNITMEQAEEIYSLRFKFIRECMSSPTHEEVIERGTVDTIAWIGMGQFFPNKKRISRFINSKKDKENGTE